MARFYSVCCKVKHSSTPTIFCMALLDKVGCAVIGDFQMDQHPLMSKVSLKSSTQDHCLVTKRKYVWIKTFLLGYIVWNKFTSCFMSLLFIMFPYTWISQQKLVMKHMNDFQSGMGESGTHKQLCIVYYIYNYLQSLTNEIRYK